MVLQAEIAQIEFLTGRLRRGNAVTGACVGSCFLDERTTYCSFFLWRSLLVNLGTSRNPSELTVAHGRRLVYCFDFRWGAPYHR
jgi:hypothetical protein